MKTSPCISDSCDGEHDKDEMDDMDNHNQKLEITGTVFIAASVDGFVAREDGDISSLSPPPVDHNVNANANAPNS